MWANQLVNPGPLLRRHYSANSSAMAATRAVRRAAFDIGSGMSKMQVADIELATGRVLATLFAEEREVLFAADWKSSGARSELSEAIQCKGIEVLSDLRQIARQLGAAQMRGVATEVFRKASNGHEYLTQVQDQLGIEVTVIEQSTEARLGWLTAVADMNRQAANSVVSWDSGGGSFQVSARVEHTGHLVCYNGSWGSTVATEALITTVQGNQYTGGESSPNPVSLSEATQLISAIRATMEPLPDWVAASKDNVIAIGGDTCIFRLASELSGLLPPRAGGVQKTQLTKANILTAIQDSVGKKDEELSAFLQQQMVVPKLCLMYAVMEQLDLNTITYQPAIGSCAGLLIHDSYFADKCYWPDQRNA